MKSVCNSQPTSPAATGPIRAAARPPQTDRRRLWLRRGIHLLLTAAVVYFVGRAMWKQVARVDWSTFDPDARMLVVAVGSLVVHAGFFGLAPWLLLRSLGQRVGLRQTLGVCWLGQLGRYVPGKVAAVAGSAWMLTRLGVRLPVAVGVFLLNAGIASLLAVAVGSLALLGEDAGKLLPGGGRWVWPIVGMCLVALHPRVFLAGANLLRRLLRRPPIETRPHGPALLAALAAVLGRCAAMGLAAWLIARALLPVPLGQWWVFLAAANLAQVIGFLAFFAPAGVGVREGVYLVLLTPVIGAEWATLLALLMRLAQVALDVIGAAVGGILVRRGKTIQG